MPNHVTNKIVFSAEHAEAVFSGVIVDGQFDFRKLIPLQPQVYQGDTTSEDEKDFPCNWYSWNRENWGTKWNAYSTKTGIVEGKAFIQFDTAWSVPYPIIAAFCNMFHIPFELRYFDEGWNFWGVETYGVKREYQGDQTKTIERLEKRYMKPDEKRALCIELKGYDPEHEDDDEQPLSEGHAEEAK